MTPRLPMTLGTKIGSTLNPRRAFSVYNSLHFPSSPSSEASSSRTPPPPRSTPPAQAAVGNSTKSKRADLEVAPLSRPLGVPKPPSSIPKTWTEKKNEMLDEDRHKATRRALYVFLLHLAISLSVGELEERRGYADLV